MRRRARSWSWWLVAGGCWSVRCCSSATRFNFASQLRRFKAMRLNKRFAVLIASVVLMAAMSGYAHAAGYVQSNLVSDIPGLAQFTDPTLLNPWGVAFFPGASPFWVNDNNAGLSALYLGSGVPFP